MNIPASIGKSQAILNINVNYLRFFFTVSLCRKRPLKLAEILSEDIHVNDNIKLNIY